MQVDMIRIILKSQLFVALFVIGDLGLKATHLVGKVAALVGLYLVAYSVCVLLPHDLTWK